MTRSRFIHAVLLFGAVNTLPAVVHAQRTVKIRGDARCSNCGVHLTRVFTIGGVDHPARLNQPNGAAINASGELILSHVSDLNRVFVFDSTGRFLRAIGRAGSGPGEFLLVRSLQIASGDTLLVFDNGGPRISAFDNTYKFVSSFPAILNSHDFVRTASGELVMNASIRTREAAGYPLHVLGASGLRRSFGTTNPRSGREASARLDRNLAAAGDGSLWAAHTTEYRIDHVDASGRVVETLVRDVDWFRPHASSFRIEADKPPAPRIRDIHVDEKGRLWILVLVADPDWKDALTTTGRIQGRTSLGYTTPDAYFDSIIEVIDPRTGELVASGRSPHAILFLLNKGMALSYREPDGVPYVDAWRLSVN